MLSVATRTDVPTIAGRVVHVENLGADVFLHVGVEGVALPVIIRHDPALTPAPSLGDPMTIALPSARLLVFDDKGRRIPASTDANVEAHSHA